MVVLLETPAKQWTKTVPPLAIASLMNLIHGWKWILRFALGLSRIEITLYWNYVGNFGMIPRATVQTCVTPFFFSRNLFEAPVMSPNHRLSRILLIEKLIVVYENYCA
jgi:hypothetical protein